MRFLLLFLLLPLLAQSPSAEPADWRAEMLAAVNQLRAQGCRCGREYMASAPPLTLHDQLTEAAQRHANDMYWHRYFSHRSRDGSRLGQRVSRTGYRWRGIAENIARGQTSVAQVMQSWRHSPGHCRNLMNPSYRHFGAGYQRDYWVQVFACAR